MSATMGEGGDDLVAALRECEKRKRVLEKDLRDVLDEVDRARAHVTSNSWRRFLMWLLRKTT